MATVQTHEVGVTLAYQHMILKFCVVKDVHINMKLLLRQHFAEQKATTWWPNCEF